MTRLAIAKDGREVRLWTCSICGREDEWGSGWEWYGAYACKAKYEPCISLVVCSEVCKACAPQTGRSCRHTGEVPESDPVRTVVVPAGNTP